MTKTKTILVTGATGKQGGAVVDALLAANAAADGDAPPFRVLAVTRDTQSSSAQRLSAREGVKLVQGNLDDCAGLMSSARQAADDGHVWGVFSVQVPLGPTKDTETEHGNALVDAALKAGVEHFVYTSVDRGGDEASWHEKTPIPHFQTKFAIEHHLRDSAEGSNMGWTILRPVAFMDNLTPAFTTGVFMAALRNNLGGGDRTLQWVATSDIGVFAAKAFADPQAWRGRAVALAGDELTMDQLSDAFVATTGRPVREAYWFLGSALTWLAAEMGVMIRWFGTDGYKADIAALRAEHPGLLTMERWIREKSAFETRAE